MNSQYDMARRKQFNVCNLFFGPIALNTAKTPGVLAVLCAVRLRGKTHILVSAICSLALLHSIQPNLHGVLAVLSAVGLRGNTLSYREL